MLGACALALIALMAGLVWSVTVTWRATPDPTRPERPAQIGSLTTAPVPPLSGSAPLDPAPRDAAPREPAPAGSGVVGESTQVRRDRLAAAPMPTLGPDAAHPQPVTTRDPGVMLLPAASRQGPAGIATGFPHTPAGAVAQLAAIDETILMTGDLAFTRDVARAWILPGGPSPQDWSATTGMAAFLTAGGFTDRKPDSLVVLATAAMALVKATDGPDWVLACVNLQVQVTGTSQASSAVADCQRLQWDHGRWMIAAGAEPAAAPSVWPGSEDSLRVGYRRILHD